MSSVGMGPWIWKSEDVTVRKEHPDGTLVARDAFGDSVLIRSDGTPVARRAVGDAWHFRDNAEKAEGPLPTQPKEDAFKELPSRDGLRVGSVGYVVADRTFRRYGPDGTLLSSVPLPAEPFEDALHRAGPDARTMFKTVLPPFPYPRSLVHDGSPNRIIASSWSLPGWVMAVDLLGHVEWVRVPILDCCNSVLVLAADDTIAHISTCGRRLTFLSGDGATRRVHDFEDHPGFISPDGAHGVFIGFVEGGLAGWDAHGSPTWSIDSPPVETAISDAGMIYAVTPSETSGLDLTAFALTPG